MARAYSTSLTPEQLSERARHAALARNSTDNLIRRLVDEAPPLTSEQRSRLAGLLARPAAAAGEPRDAA